MRFAGLISPVASDLWVRGQVRPRKSCSNIFCDRCFGGHKAMQSSTCGSPGRSRTCRPRGRWNSAARSSNRTSFDTPIGSARRQAALRPQRADLENVKIVVDSAVTLVRGGVEIDRYTPLQLGKIAFELRGDISARLLQWQFARNLAEARGRSVPICSKFWHVRGAHRRGHPDCARSVLNLRRFHELSFSRGTIRFLRVGGGDHGCIIIGRGEGSPSGVALSGLVDGDGKIELSGRVEHDGIGSFIKTPMAPRARSGSTWRSRWKMSVTARRASTTSRCRPPKALTLTGSRDGISVGGDIEVVAGRYMQDYDPADRFCRRDASSKKTNRFGMATTFVADSARSASAHARHVPRV